jgi:hypothetical protein
MKVFRLCALMTLMPFLIMANASSPASAESPASTQPTSQPAALKTLENAKGCFKFDYPASWKTSAAGSLKTIPKTAAEVETEFVVKSLSTRMPASENDACADMLVHSEQLGLKINSDEHILLDGTPAREIALTETDMIFVTKGIKVLTIRNGIMYDIQYSGPPDSYQLHKAEVDAIIKSWKWTDSEKK